MNQELEVVYTDDIKTNIEIKTMVFKPEELVKEKYNRAKKKQDDRKMAEKYIDR